MLYFVVLLVGPVLLAVVLGVAFEVSGRGTPMPLLLRNGRYRARAEARHRYFHDVGDSTTG